MWSRWSAGKRPGPLRGRGPGLCAGWTAVLFSFLLLGLGVTVQASAQQAGAPRPVIGAVPRGSLTLEDGNLVCPPYACAIALQPGQRLQPWKHSPHIFELLQGNQVVLYYFYSNDVVNMPAYSGQPIGILIGLDPQGIIRQTRLIEHSEPILLAGIPLSELEDAVHSYQDKDIRDKIHVGKPEPGYVNVDMITGATVTSLVANDTILTSARTVARQVGILVQAAEMRAKISDVFTPMSWAELAKIGAVGHLTILPQEMGLPDGVSPWLDLYFADLVQPTIGKNLLGPRAYDDLMAQLKPGQSALMVVGGGPWSFKGSAFVRGGLFDRFHIEQGLNSFIFRDVDYRPFFGVTAAGAPVFNQSGIFIITDPEYDRAQPWDLVVLGSRLTGATAVSKFYKTFKATYRFPPQLIATPAAPRVQNGAINLELVREMWWAHRLSVAWYLALWLTVIALAVFRRRLAENERRLNAVHAAVLFISYVTIGLYQQGQPSLINILTLSSVVRAQGSFARFFMDPYLAIGWIMIVVTMVFWGRSVFCGWICPFGALQELLFRLRVWFTPLKKSYELPYKIGTRLRWPRFAFFVLTFAVSLFSFKMAVWLSELEPFKTTWNIGLLHRPAPYGLYVVFLLIVGMFTYRFFCRYLCPLGAGLGLLSFFPLVRIPRRNACVSCRLCFKGCEPLAIDNRKGRINAAECLGCYTCINKMDDKKACPPLISKKVWEKFHEKPV